MVRGPGVDYPLLMSRIEDVIIKTLIAAESSPWVGFGYNPGALMT